jgi:hypothetical protein
MHAHNLFSGSVACIVHAHGAWASAAGHPNSCGHSALIATEMTGDEALACGAQTHLFFPIVLSLVEAEGANFLC